MLSGAGRSGHSGRPGGSGGSVFGRDKKEAFVMTHNTGVATSRLMQGWDFPPITNSAPVSSCFMIVRLFVS